MAQESTNVFTEGLIKDLNPITTPNNVLTDALNATLLTFNGNELVLQNDMGNTIIEGAKLSDGFIPIGVKEYGGILYIVSANPETKETEIGSFPSPQELSEDTINIGNIEIELKKDGSTLYKNYYITNKSLNSGDSFLIFLKKDLTLDFTDYISSLTDRKFYVIKLLSIENGVEYDITSTSTTNQYKLNSDDSFSIQNYWFVPLDSSEDFPLSKDISKYSDRKYVQRYKFRKKGKLAIRIELENIDKFKIQNSNNNSNYPTLYLSNGTNQTVTLLGTSGTATININSIDYTIEFDTDLTTTANNFITTYFDTLQNLGIKITSSDGILSFIADNTLLSDANITITNTSDDLTGTLSSINEEVKNDFYLKFDFYIQALADLKLDTINIDITLVDPNGIEEDIILDNLETSIFSSEWSTNKDLLKSISIDIKNSYDKIAIYTITPKNNYYGITFDDFIISDIIDLSQDPNDWGNSQNVDYYFNDYYLKDYNTIN